VSGRVGGVLAEPKVLGLGVKDVRRLVWQNFGTIIDKTGTWRLLPKPLAAIVAEVNPDVGPA
jgi:hypothetical protein